MSARWWRRPMTGACLLAGGLLAAACGIPIENAAHSLPDNQIQAPAGVTTTTIKGPVKAVYWVSNTELLVKQTVAFAVAGTHGVPLTTVLDTLLAGPSTQSGATRYTTALNSNVQLLSPAQKTTKTNVVTVNFNHTFETITGGSQILAVAQVVYTVTHFYESTTTQTTPPLSVKFEVAGAQIAVILNNGAQQSPPAPVTESDYPLTTRN